VWNEKIRRDLSGLALIALALFTLLSLIPVRTGAESLFPTGNIMGVLGSGFALLAISWGGVGAWGFPLVLGIAGVRLFDWIERERAIRLGILVCGLILLVPVTLGLLHAGELAIGGGAPDAGWLGSSAALPLIELLGGVGAWLVVAFLGAALLVLTLGWNPLTAALRGARTLRPNFAAAAADWELGALPNAPEVVGVVDEEEEEEEEEPAEAVAPRYRRRRRSEEPRIEVVKPPKPKRERKRIELAEFGDPASEDHPPVTLLTDPPPQSASLAEAELDRLGQVLIQTLRTFKVEGAIAGRTSGPVVTQFEVVPAPGVKVNRIAALDADLALALKAPSVRIVAPIPGKGAVGVDVPNPERVVVYLRSILESQPYQRKGAHLPLALGQDLAGRSYVADLAKMPHLLIAGATGSGKSICINTLITSLIYRHAPSSLRFLMIDPKMVELSMYADLPHLRHPVVTDPQDAATVLKWAVLEMARRYELLHANSARSITEFNRRVAEGQELKRAYPSGSENESDHWAYRDGALPYIVVVVDELADLMMTVQAEIEKPLAQLAQKARAIGIHLIVATQRPSVNVITGLIKANFPCRIAFRVSSKVDSRTILDQNGADALLGNGDMLFLPPGQSDPVRIQGAFLSTEDTEQLMRWYRERTLEKSLEDDILEYVRAHEAEEAGEDGSTEFFGERDALFRQAAEICVQFQQGSTSLLQRRLRIGYGRAARIIDQLHLAGLLGPPDGSKPREVLVGMESIDAICGED
jgi:S-DNA-T family DNA segregation ATPase FtsK/SpoIIIE